MHFSYLLMLWALLYLGTAELTRSQNRYEFHFFITILSLVETGRETKFTYFFYLDVFKYFAIYFLIHSDWLIPTSN